MKRVLRCSEPDGGTRKEKELDPNKKSLLGYFSRNCIFIQIAQRNLKKGKNRIKQNKKQQKLCKKQKK
ncbi:MAG: hypothetical protein E7256_14350 [Lachnospiraceae bacterium]|nr:hypothetical protein [Lachnospiraceae bacterium]